MTLFVAIPTLVPNSEQILNKLIHVSKWIKVIYHFVDVTDSYFAQRYDTDLESI